MKKCLLFLWLLPLCLHAQMRLTSYNTGTSFTCIAVDSNYNIWAGRSNGVYQLDKLSNPNATTFTALTGTANFNVQALAADHLGYLWAGHNGRGGSTAVGGGIEQIPVNNTAGMVHFSPDRNAECFTYLGRNGIGTLNCAGLAVDSNGTVWSAHKYNDLTSSPDYILTPGTFSFKQEGDIGFRSRGTYEDYRAGADPTEFPYPAYTCNPTATQTAQSRNVYSVAAGKKEVWVSVAAYTSKSGVAFPARLLKYNLDGTYTGVSATFATIGIPAGGIFNGLWLTPSGDLWATISAGKGFAVRHRGNWTYVNTANLSCIFPAGATINANAIWGNRLGQVFIGTNKGLIVYGGGSVNSKSSYTLYTAATNGLISDQILGGVAEKDSIQWLATANGIMSSTLGRNYPLMIDTADYHVCKLDPIDSIEKIADQDVTGRKDYHIYRVETQVCSTTGPNGANCNAEYVYKLMKHDASLTAPTVWDFPYDVLSAPMLLIADKNTVVNMVYQHVSAFDPATASDTNTNGGIKYIAQVLDGTYLFLHSRSPSNGKTPFLSGLKEYIDRNRRADLMAKQKADNPDSVAACHGYNLYNSPGFINDRMLYDVTVDNWKCGNKLYSPVYDQVWIYPNDQNLTFTNYTQPGHFLYPGKVFRTVVEECGKVKIVTVGTGLSYCGNISAGEINAIGNIIVGSILFKNIDLRLKKVFEAGH